MAKKLQSDDNPPHPDQQHSLHSTTHTDSSHPSISSENAQNNKMQSETIPNSRQSIDYIPPEISYDNHQDSDDVRPWKQPTLLLFSD